MFLLLWSNVCVVFYVASTKKDAVNSSVLLKLQRWTRWWSGVFRNIWKQCPLPGGFYPVRSSFVSLLVWQRYGMPISVMFCCYDYLWRSNVVVTERYFVALFRRVYCTFFESPLHHFWEFFVHTLFFTEPDWVMKDALVERKASQQYTSPLILPSPKDRRPSRTARQDFPWKSNPFDTWTLNLFF